MESITTILVIDDERDVGELITATAERMGLCCIALEVPSAFLEALSPATTLIMLDLLMPEMDGVELLRLLGERKCTAGIVLMSGTGKRIIETAEQFAQSIGLTVVAQLQKPFRIKELEAVLAKYKGGPVKAPISRKRPVVASDDTELMFAIKRNEFVLHYQPQIDLGTYEVTGVEALVRWQHPQRGLVFPDEFIARAEELGLIDDLGWIVANRGLEEVSLFAGNNGAVPILSINVSAHSLRNLKFPDIYLSLLKKHKVAPQNTILEITESGLIKELSSTLDVLTRLRLKKVQLSIDDFGTGYSMMQQLRHIPATELKIDKAFVQNMHGTDSDRVMVQKTIEIGHELGMRVIAEGVETQAQLDFLLAQHCDMAQGYLFSRPLPPQELVAWLAAYRARPSPIQG